MTVRKRWLISNFIAGVLEGTYWGIGSPTANYDPGAPDGYSEPLVDEVIAEVPTDMDAFSEAAVRRHAPALAENAAALSIPHPKWMEEARVTEALRRATNGGFRSVAGDRQDPQEGEPQDSEWRKTT